MKFIKFIVFFIFSSLFILYGNSFAENEKNSLLIMGTTDIHGNIFPVDYFSGKEKNVGLARVFTKVKELRRINKNSLLVDSGDLLQGTPLVTYYGKIARNSVDPMIKAMNLMNYDAMSVGNHEYDLGLENLFKASKDAKFPFLSANTLIHNSEKNLFTPYIIKNVGGIRVGIIGFTTPGVALWSQNLVKNKYDFQDIVVSAQKYIHDLKKQTDVLIAIPHTGLQDEESGGGYNSGSSSLPSENAGKALAINFPEIDVIILAHTHRQIKELFENGVLITQPKPYGTELAEINISLEKIDNKWKVTGKHSDLIDLKDIEPDKDLMANLMTEHNKTLEYVNTSVGISEESWDAKGARLQDTPIVDLINKVQMEATGAELSSSALFSEDARIPKGAVTIANIAGLYIYENTLFAIKINGKQLKEYLEYSARYFEKYEDGKPVINPKIPGYNYDMVSGVTYRIDLSRPVGERILDLKFKGKEVNDNMTFTMALNSYRQSGGGGYDMIKGTEVVYNKLESIRDLLINYVQKKGKISTKDVFENNWEFVNNMK